MRSSSCLRLAAGLMSCVLLLAPPASAQEARSPGWTIGHLSAPRSDLAAASFGSTALFAGGIADETPLDSADVYDQVADQWSTARLGEGRVGPSLVQVGKQVLIVGGKSPTGAYSRALDVFDASTRQWTALSLDQPWPRTALTNRRPIVIGTSVVFAGADSDQVYDSTTRRLGAPQPSHTADVAAVPVAVGSALVLAGRGVAANGAPRGVDVFDSATGTWSTTRPPLPLSDGAAIGAKVLFVSAPQPGSTTLPTATYDLATQTWSRSDVPISIGRAVGDDLPPAISSDGRRAVVLLRVATGLSDVQAVMVYDAQTGRWTPGDRRLPYVSPRASLAFQQQSPFTWLGSQLVVEGVPTGFIGLVDTDTGRVTVSSAPTRRYGPSNGTIVAVAGHVLLAGGQISERSNVAATDALDMYDVATGAWTTEHLSQPDPAPHALVQGSTVIFGGRGGLSRFDVDSASWTTLKPDGDQASDRFDPVTVADGVALLADSASDECGTPVMRVLRYDLASGDWQEGAPVITRTGAQTIAVGEAVLHVGGTARPANGAVEAYVAATGQWSTSVIPEVSGSPASAAATGLGTRVLFVLGSDGIVHVYDSASDEWSTASLSVARVSMAASSVGTLAMFAGGRVGRNPSDVVDIYDQATDAWTTAMLSQARAAPAVASTDSQAFIAGGLVERDTPSDVVDILDNASGAWSTATLSEARSDLVGASVGRKVLFAGGRAAHGASDVVDIYDASSATWSTARLSQSRARLAAASVGTRVIFAGGVTDAIGGESDVVDVYDDASGQWGTARLAFPRQGLVGIAGGGRALFAGGQTPSGSASNLVDIFTP